MKKKESDETENACPLCSKPLGEEEKVQLDKSLQGMIKNKSQDRIKEIEEKARSEIETIRADKEKAVHDAVELLKKTFEDQKAEIKKLMEEQSVKEKNQLEEARKKIEHEYTTLKENTTTEAQRLSKEKIAQIERRAKEEIERIRDEEKQRLQEKEIELLRLNKQVEELKSISVPGEVKGTAGEQILLEQLETAFPQDVFKTQKRGQKTGDIIHEINIDHKYSRPEPIVYDNKEKTRLSKTDIDKAKTYQRIHETNYVIIVCSELPKEFERSLMGEKDGILVVHPSILIEYVRQLRKLIIAIFKSKSSGIDRKDKESKLFEYIKSPKFEQHIRGIELDVLELHKIQDEEEKSHQKLWARRKSLTAQIEHARGAVDADVSAIVQETRRVLQVPAMTASIQKKKRIRL